MEKKEERKKAPLRAAAVVTGMIVLSKIIGYIREAMINATFGESAASDAYANATTLFSMFSLLFLSGIASTFIPIYTREKMKNGIKGANRYANNIVNLYIIVSVLVSLFAIFVLSSPGILGIFYKKSVVLTSQLARILFMTLTFSAVWGVLCNVLNANEKFLPETLQGFILSACVMFACIKFGDIKAVTIATALAPIFYLVSLIPFLRNTYRYEARLDLRSTNLRRTFWIALPAIIAMEFDTINNFVDTIFADRMMVGSTRILKNCYQIIILLQGVFVVPVTTVSYPQLSRSAARNDKKGIIDSMKQMTELLAVVLFPLIGIIMIMRSEVFALLFQHGKFTAEGTARAALPLACYVVGVFGFGLRNYQSRVFYSLQKTKPPMLIGMGIVGINILLDFVFMRVFSFGLEGLTLATSISGSLGALIMLLTLRKMLGQMKLKVTAIQLAKTLAAAAVGSIITLLVRNIWRPTESGLMMQTVRLGACALAGLAAYGMSAKLLHVRALRDLMQVIRRRRK